MRILAWLLACTLATPAFADYRITRDVGGRIDLYKIRYAKLRDSGERVIIDGICNSACTLVLGIVPHNRICVTPRAQLGFHQAYFDKAWTFGLRITSYGSSDDMMNLLSRQREGLDRPSGRIDPGAQDREERS